MTQFGALSDRARRFLNKRLSWRDCFMGPEGELTAAGAAVIRMLAKRCGAYKSSFKVSPVTRSADPVAMAYAEGRRDVWLYIQAMLELPDREVLNAIEDDHE